MIHIFHDWSDWAVVETGDAVCKAFSSDKLGRYLVQERFCRTCGKVTISRAVTAVSGTYGYRFRADTRPVQRSPRKDIPA